jgi:hypothetical protein
MENKVKKQSREKLEAKILDYLSNQSDYIKIEGLREGLKVRSIARQNNFDTAWKRLEAIGRVIIIDKKIKLPFPVKDEYGHAESQARAQYKSIVELVNALENAPDDETREKALEDIQNDPLSVEVRSGWAGRKEDFEAEEFRIVLCTGGPHVELRGELDKYNQPEKVELYCCDWFLGNKPVWFEGIDRDKLLTYCQQFYFGD